jgi:hypothetical protein
MVVSDTSWEPSPPFIIWKPPGLKRLGLYEVKQNSFGNQTGAEAQ